MEASALSQSRREWEMAHNVDGLLPGWASVFRPPGH